MKTNIIIGIVNALKTNFNIAEDKLVESNYDITLTSRYFGMDAIDLSYLYFILQRTFNIKIHPSKILNYQMNTINGIVDLIDNLK